MDKKEDRRVTMTRRMLKEALTEMLRETDIYHVSIRELCQRADINRTTFYKYYGSQFDLLTDMENDLLIFISNTIREYADDPVKIIETACEYMENHLEFCRLIINNNVDPLFPQRLFSLPEMRETVLTRCSGQEDGPMQEYLFHFITYGAYRILSMWVNKEQREPPEEIAHLLMRMIQLE